MAGNDKFAAIAATQIDTKDKDLVVPHVRKTPGLVLPVSPGRTPGFPAEPAGTPEERLRAKMAVLREERAPYLRELAPVLPSFRRRLDLEEFDWRVLTEEDAADFQGVQNGSGSWTRVRIPHYGGPLGNARTVYRRVFLQDRMPGPGECAFLHFDGVDYIATVLLNGTPLGRHEGFFAPFEFDCTECLRPGENVLTVLVENDFVHVGSPLVFGGEEFTGEKIYAATGPGYDDPETGWHHCPPGMGIYQNVYLEIRSREFLSDLWVRPLPGEGKAELHVQAFRKDRGKSPVSFRVSVFGRNHPSEVLRDFRWTPTAERTVVNGVFEQALAVFEEAGAPSGSSALSLEKGENDYVLSIPMKDALLWSPAHPWLYEAQVTLLDGDGTALDAARVSFGMRTFTMESDGQYKGMLWLNGEKCRLRGANTMGFEQQDVIRGDSAQLTSDLIMALACNMNFLRITQRPVQEEIYDRMDRLGLMAQTDLPLFGALRRGKLMEAVREAGEMERLIRRHPACIMVSYINEPAPDLKGTPHRFASREELNVFFRMADEAVHLENPDRVTKHVDGDYDPPRTTLQDNHCYTCWYNGFGVDAGALHKGDWLPVPPDWYYACGEFGSEGLEDEDLMRRRYPAAWLPQTPEEEETWCADRIIGCQSGGQHHLFYETPRSLAQWAERSREYQAEATKWMTEAFRRDERMVSFALHLFIDAFPSGWLKSVVDCERRPKPAFFAYENALTPTMVSLRTDRFSLFCGETAKVEAWLCCDLPRAPEGLRLLYEAFLPDGSYLSGGIDCAAKDSGVRYLGDLRLPLPDVPGPVRVRTALICGNDVLHRSELTLAAEKREAEPPIPVWLPENAGSAGRLARELDCVVTDPVVAVCAVVDDYSVYLRNREALDSFVRSGRRLVFLELPAGKYDLCGISAAVKTGFMMPRHFVSRDTGHPWVRGFGPKSFRRWYDEDLDRIAPILRETFTSEGMRPVLLSGDTDENGQWRTVMAAGEAPCGDGRLVLCELMLCGRVTTNPAARIFARRMLSASADESTTHV